MNLSEMSAEQLLDAFGEASDGSPEYDGIDLRAELLRRLQPVKPRCPKCGSERKLNWHREYSRVECQACDNFSAEVCTVEDWAVLFGPVLSREGEGEA